MNDNAIDISALAAFAGTYQQQLFTRLFNKLDAVSDLSFYPGVKNTLKMTKLSINRGAKPYTGTFKPKTGDLKYTGQDLTVQEWQRDLVIKPSDYRQSWMAANRGKGENPNNKNIPFASFTWAAVIDSLAEGINNNTVYFGVGTSAFTAYDGGTVYHAGDLKSYTQADGEIGYFRCNQTTVAGQDPVSYGPYQTANTIKWDDWSDQAICVGFGKIFANLATAGAAGGGLDPVGLGALDATNAYAAQKELWRSLPEVVQKNGGVIYQSYTDYNALIDNFESTVSKYTEIDNSGISYLPGTNRKCVLKPVTWMSGSRRLIATDPVNMIFGTDELGDFNAIATEEHIYTLDAGMSGMIGVTVRDPSQMRIGDQV